MSYLIYGFITIMYLFDMVLSILNYQYRTKPIPEVVNDVYDNDSYQKWLEYRMENHRFGLIKRTFDYLLFMLLLLFGIFPWIDNLFHFSEVVNILLFFLVYYVISFVTNIGFDYYATFSIEDRFGFNKTTKRTFVIDKIKSTVLTFIFGGGLIYLLFTIYKSTNNFILYAWLSLVVIVFITNLVYTSWIVPLFNKLTPLEEGDLKEKITRVSSNCGFNLENIYVMDASKRSSRLNAFFSGLGKTKKIILYDTLIEKMPEDAIVAVLAHEIGHNVKKHIPINFLMTLISLSILLIVLQFSLSDIFSTSFGFSKSHFGFGVIIFGVLIEPVSVITGLLSSNISRKFEYQADEYAKEHSSSAAMIQALKILGRENYSNLTPHPLVVALTYSHPTLKARIEALLKED